MGSSAKQLTRQIVLGIDPGLQRTGYAVVERSIRDHTVVTAKGIVRSSTAMQLTDRLLKIQNVIFQVVSESKPDVIAVEGIFYHRNVKSIVHLAYARASVMLVAAQARVPFVEYDPLSVKLAVVGYGRASKEQVAFMVKQLVVIEPDELAHDITDAVAVAVCHLNQMKQA